MHQKPRDFGIPNSVWTLQSTARVCFEQGITDRQVSDETIRDCMKRLKVGWQRAKRWVVSLDPKYARKKGTRPADPSELTLPFLSWACGELATEGKQARRRIWDNAGWHTSALVRGWIRRHHRSARENGGVRIVTCCLPTKSHWLNHIERKGIHGKRAVAEPGRLLEPSEIIERAAAYYAVPVLPPLSKELH